MSDVTVENVIEAVKPLVQSRTEREKIGPATPLLTSGLIDSLSVAELCDALSSAFNVEIDVADIGSDNANTPEQLASLVQGK